MTKALMKQRILSAALDEAAHQAKTNATHGVNLVVAMLNASTDNAEVKRIMDGASQRGFSCEYWPVNGEMGIRVRWEN